MSKSKSPIVDSDSDEDEALQTPIIEPKKAETHLLGLDDLKQRTTQLLDPSWKLENDKRLLNKMFEIEEPIITAKMVDFLLQDGVCELLLSFITNIGTGSPRPTPTSTHSPELKLAYKAVILLTADEPTEALMTFLSKKAFCIAKAMFDIFRDDSSGSFYHAYRVIGCLLRCYPAEVYLALCSDNGCIIRMTNLLRNVGCVPVGELIVMVVALTPLSRMSQLYVACNKARGEFFQQLTDCLFLLKITEVIAKPEEFCKIDDDASADMHSSLATQVLQELIEKLSLEDSGESLLQPLGYATELLDILIDATVKPTYDKGIRSSATRLICFLLRRAAEPEIMCIVSPIAGAPPTPTCVANRLFPLRERIINIVENRIEDITNSLINFNNNQIESGQKVEPLKFAGYSVQEPFTTLRSGIIEVITLMVESDENIANFINGDVWKLLFKWTLTYAHNNIYHALFYRLIFAVLRQQQELAQRNVFQKAKLASFLIDSFIEYPKNEKDILPKTADELTKNKSVSRGLLMNCANAIRLQASCQPPSSYLRHFLSSHSQWNEFTPILCAATEFQEMFGMGIRISDGKPSSGHNLNLLADDINKEDGIHLGSRFAKSLGFYDDIAWPVDSPAEIKKRQKGYKKKQKRRKSATVESIVANEEGIFKSHEEEEEEEDDEEDDGEDDGEDDDEDDEDIVSE